MTQDEYNEAFEAGARWALEQIRRRAANERKSKERLALIGAANSLQINLDIRNDLTAIYRCDK